MFGTHEKIHLLMLQGRLDDAEQLTREQLAHTPDDVELHLLLANLLCRRNRPKEAELIARRTMELEPESSAARFFLANALELQERNREALKSIEEGLSLDPDDVDFFSLKGRILMGLGKNAEALSTTESGLRLDPDNESCRLLRSILLARLGRRDEADAESEALLANDPEESANFCARGWVLAEENDAETAQTCFLESLRLDPENEAAREGLAYSLTLRRPILGNYLRALCAIDRLPIWLAIIAAVVAWEATDFLMKPGSPAAFQWIGYFLKVAVCLFIHFALIAPLLFHLGLLLTRPGRRLLTRDQRVSLRWAVGPMILGTVFFLLWCWGGAKNLPIHAVLWFSVARLSFETFVDPNPWLRRIMAVVACAGFAAALWVEYATFFLVTPKLLATVSELAKTVAESRETGASGSGPAKDSADSVKKDLLAVIRMHSRYVVYPSLLLYLFSTFSDNFRRWLRRHAPDE